MTAAGFQLLPFLIFLTPGLGLLVWGVTRSILPPRPGATNRWARRYGVTVTDANRALIGHYRRRIGSLELIGAGAGYLGTFVLGQAGVVAPSLGAPILTMIAGYFLGAVIAESTTTRPASSSGIRSAALAERALPDYVPVVAVWALRLLPVLLSVLAIVYAVMPKLPANPGDPGPALVAGIIILLCIVALVVEYVLRSIVGRAQPVVDKDLLAADDAMRASSIHALLGASIGMLLVGIASACYWMQYATTFDAAHLPLGIAGTIAILLSLFSWVGLGHPRSWRVRHTAPLTAS